MKKILLLLLLAASTAGAWAQPIGKSSYETMIQLAEEARANKDYVNAIEQYELAYAEREDATLIPIIAELYYLVSDYGKAERFLERALRRDKNKTLIYPRYMLGRTLKVNGKYDEAIPVLQEFLQLTTDPTLKELAQNEITGAELALAGAGGAKGVTVALVDRNVNSPFSEYSPMMAADGSTLYFASAPVEEVITMDDVNDPEKFVRVFKATRSGDKYSKAEALDEGINRPGFHSANVSISPDGRRMYFNRIELQGNTPGTAKIYLSDQGDGAWKSANEVVGVNGEWLALHPAVGELFGQEVLFFTSNMDGGQGGFDIYYATYKGDGVYGDPVNLGPKINSPGDEATPWWHNGTLYYSSTGLPTIGGYDVFYSVWDGTSWSEPANMGAAYNSSADDLYFRMAKDGYSGFFTSNRPGGRALKGVGKTCCEDIYSFSIARLFADLVVGAFDADKRQPLKGATVQVIEMVENRPGEGQDKTAPNSNRFDFGLQLEKPYMVIATHPNYFPDTMQFNTAGLRESKTFEHRFFLRPRPVEPDSIVINIEEPIVLENILYDFDDDRIRTDAEPDLQVVLGIMQKYPDIRIELGSHTDARGNDTYNRDLSQRRAESARRWLVRNGIARERIEAVGYGETVPKKVTAKQAADNSFLKESDILTEAYINALATEEQKETAHLLNRRTEFKIIEGRTSITIPRKVLQKRETTQPAQNRNSRIGGGPVAAPELLPTPLQQNRDTIHHYSSLYRQRNLRNVPIMQFDRRFVDLGKVRKGEKRTFTFKFVNRGDTDLRIDVISACDCTTTDYVKRPYKPGESGIITVTFDSTEKDESETIDVDIFLQNEDPRGNPIIEMVKYKFTLLK